MRENIHGEYVCVDVNYEENIMNHERKEYACHRIFPWHRLTHAHHRKDEGNSPGPVAEHAGLSDEPSRGTNDEVTTNDVLGLGDGRTGHEPQRGSNGCEMGAHEAKPILTEKAGKLVVANSKGEKADGSADGGHSVVHDVVHVDGVEVEGMEEEGGLVCTNADFSICEPNEVRQIAKIP